MESADFARDEAKMASSPEAWMAAKLKSVLGNDASLVDGCMRDSKAQVPNAQHVCDLFS